MKTLGSLVLGLSLASPALAQSATPADANQLHYQIDMMERVLETAVAHGASLFRDRLQAVVPDAPAELLFIDTPRVRGFKLDPYGVFFDVGVPSLNATLTWSLRTLEPNDLSVQSALTTLRNGIDPSDAELQQALQRVAVRVSGPLTAAPASAPDPAHTVAPTLPNTRRGGKVDRSVAATSLPLAAGNATAAAGQVPAQPQSSADAQPDAVLENPNDAYRTEIVRALADAMLDYSGGLPVGDNEWLTIAARGVYDRPVATPADNDARTIMIRVRGSDLAAFRARQISRDEVMNRIERRVF